MVDPKSLLRHRSPFLFVHKFTAQRGCASVQIDSSILNQAQSLGFNVSSNLLIEVAAQLAGCYIRLEISEAQKLGYLSIISAYTPFDAHTISKITISHNSTMHFIHGFSVNFWAGDTVRGTCEIKIALVDKTHISTQNKEAIQKQNTYGNCQFFYAPIQNSQDLYHFNQDHLVFKGHFPNEPIVPGVLALDLLYSHIRSTYSLNANEVTLSEMTFLSALGPSSLLKLTSKINENTIIITGVSDSKRAIRSKFKTSLLNT